jgi:hypothetical protein
MDTSNVLVGFLVLAVVVALALFVKPIRKTIGLLLVILGGIFCLSFVGAIFGIPAIVIGGILLFI